MNSELYKRYPCPAKGCLDMTIKMYGVLVKSWREQDACLINWELISSKNKTKCSKVRIHTFQNPNYPTHEVEVTPRSPNSRWYKQWD